MVALVLLVPPFLFVAVPASASDSYGLKEAAEAAKIPGSEQDLSTAGEAQKKVSKVIGDLIAAVLTFVGVIFLVLVIYGGILWMTAAGSEEKAQKAQKIITYAVIGLVIIFAAYIITSFVFEALKTAVNG